MVGRGSGGLCLLQLERSTLSQFLGEQRGLWQHLRLLMYHLLVISCATATSTLPPLELPGAEWGLGFLISSEERRIG